jgi:predicted flap endonuclease-1-like 5' DNA nuclease
MHLLFHIVYAAHANGTHHKLALDALRNLSCTDAGYWQRLFLLHAKLYLEGATAPDKDFKDFENHVLHTRDGFWGGAPEKVRSWYHHVVEALTVEDWPTAVYCAGVLSHYFMDPLQPFHTAQSEAENNIHRAAERSISQSYGALYDLGLSRFADLRVELTSDPNWLVELVCRGAERANGYYEKLIAHYHIGRGVVDPPAGLDPVARRMVAEMIRFAYVGYAGVLGRAIEEARVFAPDVGLKAATLLATLQLPAAALARHRARAAERRAVERMYDELIATGTVEQHLPEDDRVVRDLHARQVLAARTPQPQASQVFPFRSRERVVTRIDRLREARSQASADIIPLRPAGRREQAPAAVAPPVAPAYVANVTREPMLFLVPSEPRDVAPKAERTAAADGRSAAEEADFVQLTLDHDVADSASIGAKTAKRLSRHGIATVRDLVKADPAMLAVLLDVRNVTAQTVCDWQDQALLACIVPGLSRVHAQLLVAAGYRSADAIAGAEPEKLAADVLSFAVSSAGQRILRDGGVPDIGTIRRWQEAARETRAA